ncbi:MAG: glutamyl-tRNA reductase [Phycisphaeraceae bacterium]|nr:glutamyl-tRNA reductase [Phycisphaeraceae bacterium]
MRILMLGVNHRTAPVELREMLALPAQAAGHALDRLRQLYPGTEAVFLSTCNRTEIYLVRPSLEKPSAEDLITFLADLCNIDRTTLAGVTIHREQAQAIAQLFRVCAGLDSMVLGEHQILGQVRQAYELAAAHGAVGPVLHRVFQQAVAVSRQARTATGIDAGRLSIGSVAVDFAKRIFERFEDKTIVALGAGEMAKLTLRHFHDLAPAKLWLASRTYDRAARLAGSLHLPPGRGGVRPFDDLNELLVEADIVITGTSAREPIITAPLVASLLTRRRSRPLFIIDIALPRNVDAQVGTLKNVYLHNLDDLQAVVDETRGQRWSQVEACEKILFDAVRQCMAEILNRDIGQLVRALRQRFHEIGQAELDRTSRKLDSLGHPDLQPLIEEHTQRVINKLLHLPLAQLDRRQPDAPLSFYAAALRRLFDLKTDAPDTAASLDTPATVEPEETAPHSPVVTPNASSD